MNVLTIFDQRIGAIFEAGAPGVQRPFSFRRLAKRMVRGMEDETFVIDGVDTAPALYTVLVSAEDDQRMRNLYTRITDEMSQLIEAQAKKRGYTFVGRPLVRFMVDPALRHGRFSVFAENIDPRTLARLRDEENAYLGITPPQDIFDSIMPEEVPIQDEEPPFVATQAASDIATPFSDFDDDEIEQESNGAGNEFENLPDPLETDGLSIQAEDEAPACTLTDLSTGQVHHVEGERITIGREHAVGSIVLHDPNASRRHAELSWRAGRWYVRDLGSTNGTLVNDVDIDERALLEGDVLTIGVTNLEFRAG